MDQIRISVALAAYNGEKYIGEQLESILKNLTDRDEIVISDDGSTDATWDIIRERQGGRVPIMAIKGPGKGVKQNINTALRHCRGQYIFLADQDDVWTGNKVETVLPYLGRDGCTLVCHDAQVMDATLSKIRMPSFFAYRDSKPGFWNNLLKNRYMGCCMAFDRKLLYYALPIPEEVEMHDQWIGMINELLGQKSRFIGDRLLWYRRHDTNVSDFSHGTILQMLNKRRILLRALYKRKKQWKR